MGAMIELLATLFLCAGGFLSGRSLAVVVSNHRMTEAAGILLIVAVWCYLLYVICTLDSHRRRINKR